MSFGTSSTDSRNPNRKLPPPLCPASVVRTSFPGIQPRTVSTTRRTRLSSFEMVGEVVPESANRFRHAGQLSPSASQHATTILSAGETSRNRRTWAATCWMSKCQSVPAGVVLPRVCSIVFPLGVA